MRSDAFFCGVRLSSPNAKQVRARIPSILLPIDNLGCALSNEPYPFPLLRRQPAKIAPRKPTLSIARRLRSLLLLLLPNLTLILLLHLQRRQLHAMPILRPRRARRRIPIPIAIPSSSLRLLLLLSVIHSLLLLLLLLGIIRSLLLLLHHLLLIGQHLRLGLLILPCADRILHHHAAAVAGFHRGFLALAGADGAYEASGVVFLLLLFAGGGDRVEEGSAGCAGDVHLFAGGEVGGLWVGEEAARWVEVNAGAAGERSTWRCGLGLLDGGGWLVEVRAGAARERATWRCGLVVEVCAGAAGVRSTWG
jgi:hypothetical protein